LNFSGWSKGGITGGSEGGAQTGSIVAGKGESIAATAVSAFKTSEKVEVNYKNLGKWLVASILIVRDDGSYDIRCDHSGESEDRVPADRIRLQGFTDHAHEEILKGLRCVYLIMYDLFVWLVIAS
jgi:outer membrane lipoprotein SlyB